MTLRQRQTDLTRSAIIEAATEMIMGDADPSDFTMQAVADAAGVSHRTLYRHFPSRQDLINAVGAHIDSTLPPAAGSAARPGSFEEWVAAVPAIVRFARTNAEMIRRAAALGWATGGWRTDRDEHYWGLFRDRFPNLPDAEARATFAALRHALSAMAALEVGDRFGLDADGVVAAIEFSVSHLLPEIARRDAAAAASAEEETAE